LNSVVLEVANDMWDNGISPSAISGPSLFP
jgi:hypothetical protein